MAGVLGLDLMTSPHPRGPKDVEYDDLYKLIGCTIVMSFLFIAKETGNGN